MITTRFSDSAWIGVLQTDPPVEVMWLIDYWLWECSTETMSVVGLPTETDVKCWIEVLTKRIDSCDSAIKLAVESCNKYIK